MPWKMIPQAQWIRKNEKLTSKAIAQSRTERPRDQEAFRQNSANNTRTTRRRDVLQAKPEGTDSSRVPGLDSRKLGRIASSNRGYIGGDAVTDTKRNPQWFLFQAGRQSFLVPTALRRRVR